MIVCNTKRDSHVCDVPRELVLAILRVVNVEKIICFGRRASGTEVWSCFLQPSMGQCAVIYDLLIITTSEEKRSRHEIADMIEGIRTSGATVNAVVHNIVHVNEALARGSVFFAGIHERGLTVYDNGASGLVVPCPTPVPTQEIIENAWNRWFGLSKQFFNGAAHFSSCGCNNLAAFMLHQAVEAACLALIRVVTGYHARTHNLGRLIAMTGNFSSIFQGIFPRNTKEEADLFHALTRAYSDVRYRDDFKIADAKIPILIDRVMLLLQRAESLYKEKFVEARLASNQ